MQYVGAWCYVSESEGLHTCKCASYPSDIHDLDGCQLPCLNMATLVKEVEKKEKGKEEGGVKY